MAIDYELHRSYEEIDGSVMSYLDIGCGEVVMLGHSYLWSAKMWEPQIKALSRRYRVIVPELWGHGMSHAMPWTTSDLTHITQQHVSLLDKLDIDRCAIIGLSVGGMWGAELALKHPERVAALALLGTYVGAEEEHARERYLAMLDTVNSLAAVPDAIIDALLPLFLSPSTLYKREDLVENFRSSLRQFDRQMLLNTIIPLGRMIFSRPDLLSDLEPLRIPALIMTGEHDLSCPPHEGRMMAKALNCSFVELENAGHISSLETPERVTGHLLSFLATAIEPNMPVPMDRQQARLN